MIRCDRILLAFSLDPGYQTRGEARAPAQQEMVIAKYLIPHTIGREQTFPTNIPPALLFLYWCLELVRTRDIDSTLPLVRFE